MFGPQHGSSSLMNSFRPSKLVRGLQSRSYEAHIDGLRAVAILFVFAFHVWPETFPLGWLGVDIFFVVSGYLIMRGLIRDIETNRFKFVAFIGRRIRRLYPQLLAMLLASSFAALLMFNARELQEYGLRQMAAMGYFSNVFFSLEGSYFAETKYLNPLLHTWSLGVEEQFYIATPLVLIALWKLRAWKILPLALFVGALSSLFIWGFLQTGSLFPTHGNEIAFYWLPSRMWELFSGGLLAWSMHFSKAKLQQHLVTALIVLYTAAYFLTLGFFSTSRLGAINILAVVATLMLIKFGGHRNLRFLKASPLQEFGLLSYAIYVWHWPIVSFLTIVFGSIERNLGIGIVAILGTGVASLWSFKFIEIKFRYSRKPPARRDFTGVGVLSVLVASSLLFLNSPNLQSAERQSAAALREAEVIYFSGLNERVFVQHRLNGLEIDEGWDAIAIGSSRMMQVDSSVTGKRTLNISVYGANVQDLVYLALRGQSAAGVDEVFISIDPWMLNENYRDSRWRTFFEGGEPELEAALANLDGLGSAQAVERLTLARENKLPGLLFDAINQSENFIAARNMEPEVRDKLTRDGRLILNTSVASQLPELDELQSTWTHGGLDTFELSEEKMSYLNDLLAELVERRVSVNLVLMPYHPAVFDGENQSKARDTISTIQELLIETFLKHGATVFGDFDPQRVGCDYWEFLDAIHPLQECSSKALLLASSS